MARLRNIETQMYEQHVQVLVDLLWFYRGIDQKAAGRALGSLAVDLVLDIQANHPASLEKARW